LITAEFNDKEGPGGVFMVTKNGKAIYKKAFGKSNLELNTDLTTDHVFQIGSMTKQFTAIAVLMLEEQGKLSVADTISKFIPDYPSGNKITIHHLLTHTSGIKDFTKMKTLRDIAQKEMTPQMMVDFFKNEPVDFAPGEKFDYNNSGYVLLGYIIELVSGETYEDFIEKRIFEKAFPKTPIIKTSSTIAEMIKYVTNSFLAMKVSFANEMYQICQALDIDYDKVIEYAKYDDRLGTSHWSVPGPDGDFGFGGHCFPKDVAALTYLAVSLGINPTMLAGTTIKNNEVRTDLDWLKQVGRAVSE
jgi:CubicO group peptidase (beta-lactamase class C family)